ncbi:SIR2 family protein [Mycobacterium sp. TY815]|uniref:SIR2 family protein n=1 Tax=Mycobacterium sp. TY815 TaxID=3050581 RepID=UPI002740675B|nr:SIR2 family protein [Mycobacterium sp. TY815]MDP7701324.1 SIR2 family protein [Mycobacterium sp. TY815]
METKHPNDAGHVFVVKANVTTIDCDAWLCPTDPKFHVTAGFASAVGLSAAGRLKGPSWEHPLAVPFNLGRSRPLIVLCNVGTYEAESPDDVKHQVGQLGPIVEAFVELSVQHCRRRDAETKLRLALPLIGTGEGGLKGAKGDTIKPLVSKLKSLAHKHEVDIVLCTYDDLAWSAVQAARGGWQLPPAEEELAQSLAEEARAGRLVLFIGAGVSCDAGVPGWQALLDNLRSRTSLDDERDAIHKLDLRDQAALIAKELGGREELLTKIRKTIHRHKRIGLTHALLASLGVQQAVTTNYDQLYERACSYRTSDIDSCMTVLPYGRVQRDRPWLLKLHGCIEQPDHIVITRSDYLRLARERSALFGIVQALLVTKHLLFVGYSLTDDDFHRLVEEIRIATDSPKAKPLSQLGTVLTIEDWPLAPIWKDVLDVHRVGEGSRDRSGRRLQILLDRVAQLAAPQDLHILDKSFNGLLSKGERAIARQLGKLQATVEQVLTQCPDQPTARAVEKMLDRFAAGERIDQ